MSHGARLRFAGANIKGTPAMKAWQVLHDLRVLQTHADVAVVQEFKWPWYWRAFHQLLGGRWAATPTWRDGLGHPIVGAQPVFWRRQIFKRLETRMRILHNGRAGISDDRWLRAVLLAEKAALTLAAWYAGTHNVVGADSAGDGEVRKRMLYQEDLPHLDEFLDDLLATGYAVVLELDANVHKGSAAYDDLLEIFRRHGGRIVGAHGVEYLVVFDGTKTKVQVLDDWIVPTTQLETDHESRGITYRVRSAA